MLQNYWCIIVLINTIFKESHNFNFCVYQVCVLYSYIITFNDFFSEFCFDLIYNFIDKYVYLSYHDYILRMYTHYIFLN